MRIVTIGLLTLFLSSSFGCARYQSQYPVQHQGMLHTRYQVNTDQNNPNYNRNANFVSPNKPITGVRVPNDVARTIVKSHPEVQAASVIVIKNQAYVAVRLKKNSYLGTLRFEIPALVKDMEPTVRKVYVSSNPSFWKMVQGYQHNR